MTLTCIKHGNPFRRTASLVFLSKAIMVEQLSEKVSSPSRAGSDSDQKSSSESGSTCSIVDVSSDSISDSVSSAKPRSHESWSTLCSLFYNLIKRFYISTYFRMEIGGNSHANGKSRRASRLLGRSLHTCRES